MLAGTAVKAGAAEKKRILGIFYRGCEEVCKSFKAEIDHSGLGVDFVVRDINQDKSLLPKLVDEARQMKADLVLTWGTSVTLGIVGTLDDIGKPRFLNDIPVVFTVVADPFGTRIAKSFEGSGRGNVTGTFNRVPESVNVEVIRQYDPTFRKLGLLYNRNEKNSAVKFKELRELTPKLGVELVALEVEPGNTGLPDVASIPLRMKELKEKGVRWLYLGSSSFLDKNREIFTSSAVENGIAVVSPYERLVRKSHALLSVAARYQDVGRLAAQQALKILRDRKDPSELPIVRATDFAYVINMEVAKKLNRFPPFSFLQIAEAVKK